MGVLSLPSCEKRINVVVKKLLYIHRWFLLSLLTIILVAGCSHFVERNASPSAMSSPTDCRTVQHVMGETCIPSSPQRLITLDSAIFSNSLALNVKPIAAALSNEDLNSTYLVGKTDGVTIVPSTNGQFSLEEVLPLHADLIMGSSNQLNQGLYERLSQIAPTVLLPWKEISYDWKRSFQETAVVLNKTETADQLMSDYNSRVEDIKRAISSISSQENYQELRAAFAFANSSEFRLALKNSFSGTILSDVGFQTPLPQNSNTLWFSISEEYLPELDVDILFVGGNEMGDRSILEQLQQKPLWSKIRAVEKNQVYSVDFQVWYGVDILAAQSVLDDLEKYLVNTP
jgi:iron complex transport system substrate-binding protein